MATPLRGCGASWLRRSAEGERESMSRTREILRHHQPHADMGLAELRRNGFLRQCYVPAHGEDCVVFTGKEAK